MNKYLFSLLILIGFISCETKNEDITEYLIIEDIVDGITSRNKTLIRYDLKDQGLIYCYSSDKCFTYQFEQDGNSLLISSNGDSIELLLEKKKNYYLDTKEFEILKYLSGSLKFDGELQHFWSPKFGVILIKSTTWNGIQVLKKNACNASELNSLIFALMNDNEMMVLKEQIDNDEYDSEIDSLINIDL